MAKVKTTKTKSKAELTEEINDLQEQVSGLNEYVNELEEDVEGLIDDATDSDDKIESLVVALADSNAVRKQQAAGIEHLNKALNFYQIGVELAKSLIDQSSNRIAELEQDLHHMTMQRDAKVDRVKELESEVKMGTVSFQVYELRGSRF